MYPVSTEFMEKMKSDRRRVLAKVTIDYTDPFLDPSIEVQASEQANVSYPAQTADAILEPLGKIASLDGSWVLDGSFALAPGPEETDTYQMGWWGSQLSQVDGTFVQPYPTLTMTYFARPIHSLRVVGDSKRGEYPVDFRIDLYGPDDTLLYTENVSGNTEMVWSKSLPSPILNVAKQVLTITKWSYPGRQAKILEFFTSIKETYEDDDIISIHLLEEREVSQGSLPVGNISANEIEIRLNNETRKFDAGNKQSPLYQTLRVNRRIMAWLGVETTEGKEYVPLGTFWSGDWRVPEDGVYAQTTGRDRLELLRHSTYSTSEVLPKPIELTPPTFTRASKAYLSDGTEVDAGAPRFEQGQFGQAVLVEEGTTNIFPHSKSFEECSGTHIGDPSNSNSITTDVGGGWKLATQYNSATIKISEDGGLFGSKRLSFIHDGSSGWKGAISSAWSIVAGKTYTVTVWARANQASMKSFSRGYAFYKSGGQQYLFNWSDGYPTDAKNVGKWVRGICTFTATADDSGIIYLYGLTDGETGLIIDYDGLQVEEKPYATSFIDGTRAAETLTIPTAGVLNPQEGTVELWVKAPIFANYNNFFSMSTSNGRFLLFCRANGSATFDYGPGSTGPTTPAGTIEANNWYYIVLRWSATTGKQALFINGVKYEKDLPNGVAISFPSTVSVVNNYSAYIDDLRISSRARSDAEILATYSSNIPAVWDEDTTYLLRFDGNLDNAQQTVTLYNLVQNILRDAGLTEEEYFIDHELKQFPVPYAYFEPQSHREALRKIAEACIGQVYCDRNGIIRIEGPSFLQTQTEPVATITQDDYFRKDNPVKWSEIANYIEVETQPLKPDVSQEVYRSNEPVPITAGQTKTITAYYNYIPCIEATATLENAVSGAQITKATYYAWGADITVTSTNTGTFELVINAKPLKVLNKEKVIAKDDASIADNGMLKYTFPANPLVQTREAAQKIADALLAYFKNPKRDVEIEWRGNPALLLGDRIAVVDKDETNEYYVTRQELEFDGALRARLNGRRA